MANNSDNDAIKSYCFRSAISLIFWTILVLINLFDVIQQESQGYNIREGIAVYQQVAIVFYGIAALGSFVLFVFAFCNPNETLRFYFISVFLALIFALIDIILYLIKSKFLIALIFLIFVILNAYLFFSMCVIYGSEITKRENEMMEVQGRLTVEAGSGAQISDGTGMLPKFAMNVHVDKVNDDEN